MASPSFSSLSTSQQVQNPMLQAILIVIVLAVFGWFILGPKFSQNQQTQAELDAVTEQRENLEADQAELNSLIAELEDSDEQVELLDEAVPLTARPTRVSLLIESFAQNSGMVISQLSIGETDEFIASGNKEELADPYQASRALATIDVNLSVLGSIEQFRNFLILLEQSGRIIDVESLTVTSGEDSESYNLKVKTYAYELATASAVDATGEVAE
jgi:Tfp pilus assembly protein PilO